MTASHYVAAARRHNRIANYSTRLGMHGKALAHRKHRDTCMRIARAIKGE